MATLLGDATAVKGRVAFVTGASRGLGRAMALLLTQRGANVVATARDEAELQPRGAEIRCQVGEWLSIPMDVRVPGSVHLAIEQAIRHYGRIDVLINNAGIVAYGPIDDLDPMTWNDIIDTNISGAFYCIQEVLPIMKQQHDGHIINIGSHAGLHGIPNLSAYSTSKFGLMGLTQSLGLELKGTGVLVSCVCPPAVRTQMMDSFPKNLVRNWSPRSPEQEAEQVIKVIDAGQQYNRDGWIARTAHNLSRKHDRWTMVWNSWDQHHFN